MILVDFSHLDAARSWRSTGDAVMGGKSRGMMAVSALGFGVFSGHVSLAKGGGFASVRTEFSPVDLTGYSGVYLEVYGSPKRVKLNLKDSLEPESCTFQAAFQITESKAHRAFGTWHKISLPFSDFVAKRRGVGIQGQKLHLSRIVSLGLVVGDSQSGDFCVNIRVIGAYK